MPVKIILRKTSLVDYPGCISAVLFFPGCNLRCPWCHNGELVLSAEGTAEGSVIDAGGGKTNADDSPAGGIKAKSPYIRLEDALAHIEKRRNVLKGVVLSGGEPTLFPGLADLIGRIKSLGLKVKLDTNGLRPGVLEELFALPQSRPDYVAMDLKTAPERYIELLPGGAAGKGIPPGKSTAGGGPSEALRHSAALIRASGIAHEFRSLALPAGYFTGRDRAALAELAGDSPWTIRPFIPGNCLDPRWDEYPANELLNQAI